MAPEQRLRVCSEAGLRWFEVGDWPPASDNGEVLTPMLDGIQKVREVPGRLSRAHVGHVDQIIGFHASVSPKSHDGGLQCLSGDL